jgi:hypothetical protein
MDALCQLGVNYVRITQYSGLGQPGGLKPTCPISKLRHSVLITGPLPLAESGAGVRLKLG